MTILPPSRAARALVPLALVLAAPALSAPPALVLLPLDSPPYLAGIAAEISAIAAKAATPRFRVIGPDAAARLFPGDALARLAACADVACRAGVLSPLGAGLVLGGALTQGDTAYEVHLWLLDAAHQRQVASLDRSILIASRRLEADMKEALPKMLAGQAEPNAKIAVTVSPGGAVVSIDDSPAGTGGAVSEEVSPGKHRVVIREEGYLSVERWLTVGPGETVRLDEKLVPAGGHGKPVGEAERRRPSRGLLPPAGWAALAVAAAAFGTGLYFGGTANSLDHRVGRIDANGVDQGLTRAQALQGLGDARTANYLFAGAGAALAVAVVFAVLQPGGQKAPESETKAALWNWP